MTSKALAVVMADSDGLFKTEVVAVEDGTLWRLHTANMRRTRWRKAYVDDLATWLVNYAFLARTACPFPIEVQAVTLIDVTDAEIQRMSNQSTLPTPVARRAIEALNERRITDPALDTEQFQQYVERWLKTS